MKSIKKIPPIYSLWILIVCSLIVFVGLSFSEDIKIGSHTLKKGNFPESLLGWGDSQEADVYEALPPEVVAAIQEQMKSGPDTTIHNVLVIGDSMTHYLGMSISKYGSKNNYAVTGVTWESSSITGWSNTDKIQKYLDMVKPDFIIVSMGANDMNLKYFEKKIPEIRNIISRFDTIPFIWVGPPLWKEDKGLYPMLEKAIGADRLFIIKEDFSLPRGKDRIHPTRKGADIWTDTLMSWIRTRNMPLPAEKPDGVSTNRKHQFIYLKANE